VFYLSMFNPDDAQYWLCPDLRAHWQLRRSRSKDQWLLCSRATPDKIRFDAFEGYALSHFSGRLTVQAVQQQCEQRWGDLLPPDFVVRLLQKLVSLGVLVSDEIMPPPNSEQLSLKPGVRWFQQPDGHWILGDPAGLRHLQVSPQDKHVIEHIGSVPLAALPQRCQCLPQDIKRLMHLLAQGEMLAGVASPKPSRRKFTPMQLLYFKATLFNPDRWLSRQVRFLHWLWSLPMALGLSGFLGLSGLFAIAHQTDITWWGQFMIQTYGWQLLLPFGLLSMAVVSLHELAHAFTVKHFGGIVPDMGLLFMCLIPAAYTNSSDSYRMHRWQRCLVIGAGVLCQVVIAAISFWLLYFTANSSSLHTGAYLLMAAALFTVALNLNPLARFDGYHLLVAATGINNLRSRSFLLYAAGLRRQPSPERGRDRWILAIYAPLSLLYLILVFGQLFLWLGNTILTHIPYLALLLFGLWLIYYYYPEPSDDDCIPPS